MKKLLSLIKMIIGIMAVLPLLLLSPRPPLPLAIASVQQQQQKPAPNNNKTYINSTVYYEDGSNVILYDNGTERHFTHNLTGPEYVYENETIYYASNGSEMSFVK